MVIGDIVHDPCAIPNDSYLLSIVALLIKLKLFSRIFPKYFFNSVLINKYSNGNSHIPMHSDDEDSIKPGSSILTISLGETRSIKFQPKNDIHGSAISISLQHGDAYMISFLSQNLFKHGIPKDNAYKSMRIIEKN